MHLVRPHLWLQYINYSSVLYVHSVFLLGTMHLHFRLTSLLIIPSSHHTCTDEYAALSTTLYLNGYNCIFITSILIWYIVYTLNNVHYWMLNRLTQPKSFSVDKITGNLNNIVEIWNIMLRFITWWIIICKSRSV